MKNLDKIKVIALDLDGTLLNEDHQLSEISVEIINEIRIKGKKIILASGRSYKSLSPFARELALDESVVCYNGAAVFYHPTGEKLIEYPLIGKWAPILIEESRQSNTHLHLFKNEQWYYEKYRKEVDLYTSRCGFKGVCTNFDNMENLICTKAMFIGETDKLKEIYARLKGIIGDDVYIAYSTKYFLEVMCKGVSKAKALKDVLKKDNINLSEVISFGDGMNDLELVTEAGIGYAMANGSEELIQAASYMAPPNFENGVARTLSDLFL